MFFCKASIKKAFSKSLDVVFFFISLRDCYQTLSVQVLDINLKGISSSARSLKESIESIAAWESEFFKTAMALNQDYKVFVFGKKLFLEWSNG